jgi:predicted Rossmann-fold nucleotide-binding protein
MAAAARGAKSVGGATVGLPISSWTHLAPDESHDELWWCENFSARANFILSTRAVVVLDGGVGTLSELAIVWSTAQTEIAAPSLFLVGEIWRHLYPILTSTLLVSADDAAVPMVVSTNDEVLRHLVANVPRRSGSGPRG